MPPPVIEVSNLQKRYGETVAVADVSLRVEAGEIFGLIGPNGAGKTTSMECIEGLRRWDGGTVRVLGLDPRSDAAALQDRIGVQHQEAHLQKRIKVWEAVDLWSWLYRHTIDTDTLLGQLGLVEKRNAWFMTPRAHRHRYHGALAPNARLRPDVVRYGRPDHEIEALDALAAAPSPPHDGPACAPCPDRLRWAQLLSRVYELDPLRCPGCNGTLRILAFLTDPSVVQGILRHLALPHRPPRLAPARAPPQAEIDFDQTPQWEREAEGTAPPRPHRDPFNQSLPDDDGTWSA